LDSINNVRPLGRIVISVVGAILLVALALPRFVRSDRNQAETASADREPAPRVTLHTVTPQPLAETLTTPGTLVADERIEVVSEIAGKVEQILFQEGSRVAAGELLVKIDDRELLAEHQRIKTRLELAERRFARQRELHDQGLISDEELEAVRTEADALRAELAQIEVRLDKTSIRAPFGGVVGLRRVSEGAFLSPQTRIATLVDSDPIKLEFAVPDRYAARLRPGEEVRFRVEGLAEDRRATLYAVEPSVDPATRTVPMRALAKNPDGKLLPGSFADVVFAVREVEGALTVPSIAVIPELGGKKVWVLEHDAAQPRPVETGIRTGDRIEITRGLAAGEQVITSGLQMLRPGRLVEVEGETTP
jgi:membrane fusion protein (multidrug efflux system)